MLLELLTWWTILVSDVPSLHGEERPPAPPR
jgi:hypothetical protein